MDQFYLTFVLVLLSLFIQTSKPVATPSLNAQVQLCCFNNVMWRFCPVKSVEASSPTAKPSRAALGAVALAFHNRSASAGVAALRSDGTPLWLVSPHLNMMDDTWVECGSGVTATLCVTLNPNAAISFAVKLNWCLVLVVISDLPDLRSVLNPSRWPTSLLNHC